MLVDVDALSRAIEESDLVSLVEQDAPAANEARVRAEREEARVRAERDEARVRAEREEARRQEEQRRNEQEQRRQRIAEADAFRRAIKPETETNCGPALEIKGSLVKVYFPVANYGNEHWIRRDQLFPPKYGCRFFNGRYEPPLP
jgi:hypothetical protein